MEAKTIYLIAGEASGENLGAKLMHALKEKYDGPISFHGIGGEGMQSEGLKSLFPMSDLSLMGFMEIVPHFPRLLYRLEQTYEDILRIQPDVVVTIDSPGFNFRLAKKLYGKGIRLVHYVAPTVWAYKPDRVHIIAKYFDHLLTILPFEKPYFDAVDAPTTYVGHPIVEDMEMTRHLPDFREKFFIPPEKDIITLLPGSRRMETQKLLPIFSETLARMRDAGKELFAVIPAVSSQFDAINECVKDFPVTTLILENKIDKFNAYKSSKLAIAKSGTGALELSMMGTPTIVTYKVNPITRWILLKVKGLKLNYANLVNIMMDQPIIPELLQKECTPERLSECALEFLDNPEKGKTQIREAKKAISQLGAPHSPYPSEKAADVVLEIIATTPVGSIKDMSFTPAMPDKVLAPVS